VGDRCAHLVGFDLILDGPKQGAFGKGFVGVFAHGWHVRGWDMQCASEWLAVPFTGLIRLAAVAALRL
jgi:hypothetical protein